METKLWMSILLFLATALMLFVAILCYRKRHLPVTRTMILTMLAAAFYSLGCAFEILSRNLGEVKLSVQIEYIGIPFVCTLWLFQAIQFTGVAAGYRKRLAAALFIVPVAIFFLHLTNDWHHLVYERYILNANESLPLYTTVKGPGYAVHAVYNYAVLVAGIALFVPMYWRALPIVRKQIAILLLGAVAPALFNLCFWLGVRVDLTPLGFAVSGVAYVWGILKLNLLQLTPIALTKVFETIRDGVILLDNDNRIVSYNAAAAQVLPELDSRSRYPADMDVVLSDSPELLGRLHADSAIDRRFPFHRCDADRCQYYTCSLSPIHDSGGITIGRILMFNDITELKENEARLHELNAFKDKLFTVVAHDIRDPIALLVSLTELISDELTDADSDFGHAELIRELKRQVQGTFQLVENLLDWYRSQKGKVIFRPSGWNLRQVVLQALSLVGTKAAMKQIRLSERIDEQIAVEADKEMLDLILRNLLSNAIKYTGIGGMIEIDAIREGDWIVVSVRDNGTGIDNETSEMLRMEEPFMQSSETEGSGEMRFGLTLTREFVRIHGGRLWFDSATGVGTSFSFTLPSSINGRNAFASREWEAKHG